MCRVVIRPVLLRPPVFGLGTSSDFSGVDRVSSTKSATDEPRRPGVVGLYLRIPMFESVLRSARRSREDVDALTLGHRDDGALGVGTLAGAEAGAPLLAGAVQRVHAGHLHVEHRLDRDLDLGLVGVRRDEERVLVLVQQAVRLLADDRRQQDVAVVADLDVAHLASPSASLWESVTSAVGSSTSATLAAVAASSASLGSADSSTEAAASSSVPGSV